MPLRIRMPMLITLCGLLLNPAWSSDVAADPWQPVHPVQVPSSLRNATYGWVLEDVDSGSDPVLSESITASTVWANGRVDDTTPVIRTGLDFPIGEALFNLRLAAGQTKLAGRDGRLLANEIDTTGDDFSDLLIWRRQESGIASAGQNGTIALRAGLRSKKWGAAFSFARERVRRFPESTLFAFPNTTSPLQATAESASVFNLDTGEQLSQRDFRSHLTSDTEALTYGVDFGFRVKSLALALGLGFERQTERNLATGRQANNINGALSSTLANRRFKRIERAMLVALRLDGKHEVGPDRHVIWTGGLRVRRPMDIDWSNNLESLETETVAAGLASGALEEWVRNPQLQKHDNTQIDARLGLGLVDEGPLFRYGFGLDWRAVNYTSKIRFLDALTLRIDDPGIPGQTPQSSLRADGSGLWSVENKNTRYEYAIGGGGRYAVTPYLGLLMGSRVGYRQTDLSMKQTLIATEPVSGERETDEGAVIDPVEIPYTNFDLPDEVVRTTSETFIDLNFGFSFHINKADLTTLFTLNDAKDLAVVVEGVWRF